MIAIICGISGVVLAVFILIIWCKSQFRRFLIYLIVFSLTVQTIKFAEQAIVKDMYFTVMLTNNPYFSDKDTGVKG